MDLSRLSVDPDPIIAQSTPVGIPAQNVIVLAIKSKSGVNICWRSQCGRGVSDNGCDVGAGVEDRKLDDANRAGNKNAAQIHHQALIDLLQRIKTEIKDEKIRE